MPTFLTSISRVLSCAKVHVAATALVTTWFAVHYAASDLPPTQRASLWVAFIGAVAVALREIINAWTEEDVAKAEGNFKLKIENCKMQIDPPERVQGSGFRVQEGESDTNQRAAIGNTQAVARAPLQRVFTPPSLNPEPPTLNPPQSSPTGVPMPPRTKLPLLLLALLSLCALAACQTCPDLAVYREGLHAVDEPLYQSHLLLMDDAVKAGIRTDADRAVVQQGIAAARALYNQAVAATTQPAQ